MLQTVEVIVPTLENSSTVAFSLASFRDEITTLQPTPEILSTLYL